MIIPREEDALNAVKNHINPKLFYIVDGYEIVEHELDDTGVFPVLTSIVKRVSDYTFWKVIVHQVTKSKNDVHLSSIEQMYEHFEYVQKKVYKNIPPVQQSPSLSGAGWVNPIVQPWSNVNKCSKCGMVLTGTMGYVCQNFPCPSGLGSASSMMVTTSGFDIHSGVPAKEID